MTRYDAVLRQLADNERDHGEQKERLRIQVRLKSAYVDELEDMIRRDSAHYAIAVEMLAGFMGLSMADVAVVIGQRYERGRKAAVGALTGPFNARQEHTP